MGVFLSEDIVGHHPHGEFVAEGAAEGEGESGFAGADGSSDADGVGAAGVGALAGSVALLEVLAEGLFLFWGQVLVVGVRV